MNFNGPEMVTWRGKFSDRHNCTFTAWTNDDNVCEHCGKHICGGFVSNDSQRILCVACALVLMPMSDEKSCDGCTAEVNNECEGTKETCPTKKGFWKTLWGGKYGIKNIICSPWTGIKWCFNKVRDSEVGRFIVIGGAAVLALTGLCFVASLPTLLARQAAMTAIGMAPIPLWISFIALFASIIVITTIAGFAIRVAVDLA